MFDWFVLLTPLILAPILLLFAFVGCHLVSGVLNLHLLPTSLTFELVPGLDTKFIYVSWSFDRQLTYEPPRAGVGVIGGGSSQENDPCDALFGAAPQASGQTVVCCSVGVPSGGIVRCECRVSPIGSPANQEVVSTQKNFSESVNLKLNFTLSVDGNDKPVLS